VQEPAPAFRRDRFERLHALDDDHFWFVARRERIVDLVERYAADARLVVDVGCGTGRTVRAVAPELAHAVGIDLHEPQPDEVTGDRVVASTDALPLRPACSDLVLALDVVEHVDDEAAVGQIRTLLRPGGRLVLTVPAFAFLWSFRDVDAGHRRRYTARQARVLVQGQGFEVLTCSYFLGLLFPLVVTSRLLGRIAASTRDAEDAPSPLVNRVLTALLRVENRAARAGFHLPFGSSVVLVAARR
jgi:SAM-dependent methyltransferase